MYQPQAPATSVQNAFKPAFEEIARRTQVARGWVDDLEDDKVAHFEPSSDATRLPFELPDQEVFVVSMGTAVLAPRPVDIARPALRVYGAFATREDAMDQVGIIRELDPECSIVLMRRNKWVLMPATEAARDDPEEAERRLQKRMAAHAASRADDRDIFLRAVRDHEERPAPRAKNPEDDDEETREAEALLYKPPRRLRGGGEVRGQAAVALCAMPDPLGGECLVKLLGCFESTAEADNWVRNVASRHETEHDIVVAQTCEWCYPNGGSQQTSQPRYRIPELQRIMDAADRNPQAVRQFKDWKREQDERKAARAAEEAAGEDASHIEDPMDDEALEVAL
jgi:Tfp pilus assembly protein PilX